MGVSSTCPVTVFANALGAGFHLITSVLFRLRWGHVFGGERHVSAAVSLGKCPRADRSPVAGVNRLNHVYGADHFPGLDVIFEAGYELVPTVFPEMHDRPVTIAQSVVNSVNRSLAAASDGAVYDQSVLVPVPVLRLVYAVFGSIRDST